MSTLLLSEYDPVSELCVPETPIVAPQVPVIDAHNHTKFWLRTGRPAGELLREMDAAGVEKMVNISGLVGDDNYQSFAEFEGQYPDRFLTIATLDLAPVDQPDFPSRVREEMFRLKDRGFHGVKVWKNVGLRLRDGNGYLVAPDDERLTPIWRTAAELNLPVYLHLADPVCFFKPLDGRNERYEILVDHPDWHFHGDEFPSFQEMLAAQERLLDRETETTFVLCHVGAYAENLAYVGRLLDTHPRVSIDISARVADLGRQPYTARSFYLKYEDRILFGIDTTPQVDVYRLYYRFHETMDEYMPPPNRKCRWRLYGIGLPDRVVAKVYRENAMRLFGGAGR